MSPLMPSPGNPKILLTPHAESLSKMKSLTVVAMGDLLGRWDTARPSPATGAPLRRRLVLPRQEM